MKTFEISFYHQVIKHYSEIVEATDEVRALAIARNNYQHLINYNADWCTSPDFSIHISYADSFTKSLRGL